MISVQSLNEKQHFLVTHDKTVLLFNKKNDLESLIFEYKHTHTLTFSTYLPKKNLIIISDEEKKMLIINRESKTILATKNVVKKASDMIYKKDESELLIADKTGDVYTLNLEDFEKSELKLLMGHLSVITDLKLTGNEKYLLTADRDEKVRISSFKNSYNIKSYLMGHKEFVSKIELIDDDKKIISASGDSTLILWDFETSKACQQIDTTKFIKNEDVKNLNGINHFSFDHESNNLFVHLFHSKQILTFKYSGNQLNFVSLLDMNERIDFYMHLYDNFHLFIFENRFSIKRISDCQVSDLEKNDKLNMFQSYLNENIDLSNARKELVIDYQSGFKNIIYSNVEIYYERKQERLQGNIKKLRTDKNTSETIA